MKAANNNNSEKNLGVMLLAIGLIAMLIYIVHSSHPLWLMAGSILFCLSGIRRIGKGYTEVMN